MHADNAVPHGSFGPKDQAKNAGTWAIRGENAAFWTPIVRPGYGNQTVRVTVKPKPTKIDTDALKFRKRKGATNPSKKPTSFVSCQRRYRQRRSLRDHKLPGKIGIEQPLARLSREVPEN